MPRSSRSAKDCPSIEDELRWVEDSVPSAPGAALLPTDDVGFAARLRDDETASARKQWDNPAVASDAKKGSACKPAVWAAFKFVAVGFVIGAALAVLSHLLANDSENSRTAVKTMMHGKTFDSPDADAAIVKVQVEAVAKQAAHEDMAARLSADKACLKLEGVQNVAFMNLATNEASTDRDPAATPFCQCKKELSASGPGSRNGVDYGRYPIQRGWSQFPASCVDGACKCFDAGAAS